MPGVYQKNLLVCPGVNSCQGFGSPGPHKDTLLQKQMEVKTGGSVVGWQKVHLRKEVG